MAGSGEAIRETERSAWAGGATMVTSAEDELLELSGSNVEDASVAVFVRIPPGVPVLIRTVIVKS